MLQTLKYACIAMMLLLLTDAMPVTAQPKAAADKEQLTKDMYKYFGSKEYDKLKEIIAQLKEICLKDGDEHLYYKAWGNEILRTPTHEGRPQALVKLKAMREYATSHDSKFGLYTSYFVGGYILNQMGDYTGAKENYLKAVDYLERYFPHESKAPIYNNLSQLFVQTRQDSASIHYSKLALADPYITPLHRLIALSDICIAYGWTMNREDFDKAYDQLERIKEQGTVRLAFDQRKKVEIFRAMLHGRHQDAQQMAREIHAEITRLLFIYKTYEWGGDYENCLFAYRKYRGFIDSLNTRELRNQAKLYQTELNVAKAENESKDLRLANRQLMLEQVTNELKSHQLEAEAAKLKLENAEIELYNANIVLRNDSLERRTQDALLSEFLSRVEAQEQKDKARRTGTIALAVVSLLTVAFLLIYLYRRRRAAKQLQKAHDELQAAYDQLEEHTAARERIESELRIAHDIQMSMVPQEFPNRSDIDLYASMKPAKAVGGDLYDFFFGDDIFYFCIGDVAGKGVPASMLMAVAVNLFRIAAKGGLAPEEVAVKMNQTIASENANGLFVTMFIGRIDLRSGRMDYCNCGHNPILIDGEYMQAVSNTPVGLWEGLEFVGQHVDDVRGKEIFLYTDGLNEAENAGKEQFGEDRLQKVVRRGSGMSSRRIIEATASAVALFVGQAEQSDDLTMMCIKPALQPTG